MSSTFSPVTSAKKLQATKEEQNQLKHELTQNAAHELKTPVASIQGYLGKRRAAAEFHRLPYAYNK